MYRLYDFAPSGNCYKLRLALSHLGIEYERIPVDITEGETRTRAFLDINPNGKVPVLQTPDGGYLAESNAALWYLTKDTALWPTDRLEQARVLQWMFFEQYSHEPCIATSRYWITILNAESQYQTQLHEKRIKGYEALGVMERGLERAPYLVADNCSIADIALYAYTHVADEGGFDLASYPAIRAWLYRVEQLAGYVPINA